MFTESSYLPDITVIDILAATLASIAIITNTVVTKLYVCTVAMNTWVGYTFIDVVLAMLAAIARSTGTAVPAWIAYTLSTVLALVVEAVVVECFATLT